MPQGGQLIFCADDSGALETAKIAFEKRPDIKMIPYGENADGDYRLKFGRVEGGKQYFEVACLGECAICVPGKHNVRNSAAAVALNCELLKTYGKDLSSCKEKIKEGLLSFAGGRRRSEIVGRAKTPLGQEVIFIDDYGHHPTAIKTTLEGFRNFYKGHKIIVDFMSHTYTRTAALLEEFASSFESADMVVINKIYGSAREKADSTTVTGKILAEHAKKYHPNIVYAKEFEEAAQIIESELNKKSDAKDGYVFVTMGAGDNFKVGKMVLEKFKV